MTKPKGKNAGEPFWRAKSLHEMTREEWESLCDGCGRCCLNKLEDWDTAEIYWTNIACSELDCETCRCKSYDFRFEVVPDCIDLTPEKVLEINWLPPTCAYRLVKEGKDLFDWHPLKTGDPESVHKAGVSVRGRAIPEAGLSVEDYENHIVTWPEKVPKRRRNQAAAAKAATAEK